MIDIINLNKRFDNGFTALESVSFSVKKGDLVCLLGPSGCGKSTILNLIAGLLTPTGGDIQFDGASVIKTAPKDRNIGFVFQNYALYPHMTVLENVMFPLTVGKHKMAKAEAQKIAEEYMKLTNIEELSGKKPGTLSGGQQQRVAITRALVQKPDILLLDEPLSNLDARLRLRIREEIRRLVKEVGITAIFVTHDQEEALSISDKIILMNEGVVQQYALPQELYLEPANLFVANFIGSPIINTMKITVADGQMNFGDFQVPLSSLTDSRKKTEITDGSYTFAIRSEDVKPEISGGVVEMETDDNEVIGRDCILRFEKNGLVVKSVVTLDQAVKNVTRSLIFNFSKAFVFNEAGERVY
ncbi:MAG: ATP-binding cassette domain-containing protein [Streptococcaceae bacterium]|jgi:multiple sugar transport system ATP-binding protein|nr:ATP-binding cassette domain-containing protein [Streptococcaceae bacterium]